MKKHHFLIPAFLLFFCLDILGQTVYVNQTGNTYHTKKCKVWTKNFEAVPLWKAKGAYGKTPCPKCKPPVKEGKVSAIKKPAAKKGAAKK